MTQETQQLLTALGFLLQAGGTIGAIIWGIIRIERRFTTMEIDILWIKKNCPKCLPNSDNRLK